MKVGINKNIMENKNWIRAKFEDIRIGDKIRTCLSGNFFVSFFTGTIYHIEKEHTEIQGNWIVSVSRDDRRSGTGKNGTWEIWVNKKTIGKVFILNEDWDN
jgi:hypothetical protein